MYYYLDSIDTESIDDCTDSCESYVELKAELYINATTFDGDDECNNENFVGKQSTLYPTGCYNLYYGGSEMIECTDDDVTVTIYEDEDCTGTMVNSTTISNNECDNGAKYSILHCGSNNITLTAVFAIILIIKLLQ